MLLLQPLRMSFNDLVVLETKNNKKLLQVLLLKTWTKKGL